MFIHTATQSLRLVHSATVATTQALIQPACNLGIHAVMKSPSPSMYSATNRSRCLAGVARKDRSPEDLATVAYYYGIQKTTRG